jgi:hypothetical protein
MCRVHIHGTYGLNLKMHHLLYEVKDASGTTTLSEEVERQLDGHINEWGEYEYDSECSNLVGEGIYLEVTAYMVRGMFLWEKDTYPAWAVSSLPII